MDNPDDPGLELGAHRRAAAARVAIRAERPEDAAAIASLIGEAFDEEMPVRLVEAIRRGSGYVPGLALVAEVEGQVVGHVMVSTALLRDGDQERRVATLSPLAVLSGYQRQGIGAALVREVVRLADRRGEPAVVLAGSPRYYSRFGFEPSAAAGITMDLPSWAAPEAAQVLRLQSYDAALRGHLVFPALDAVAAHGRQSEHPSHGPER